MRRLSAGLERIEISRFLFRYLVGNPAFGMRALVNGVAVFL